MSGPLFCVGGKPLRHRCAMPPPLSRGGFGISEKSASSPEAPLLGATATTAASGGNREELLGQRPAGCKRQRSRRWEPQPGLGERSETERASPSPESRHAAISRFFGRAMLSLRLFLFVGVLALSGAPRQLSQRESQKAFFLTVFLHSRRKPGDSRRFY